jgi:fused signal recognition particle receptor
MFSRLKSGIARTRDGLRNGLERLFKQSERVDAATLEDLEALLLKADVGVKATSRLVAAIGRIPAGETAVSALRREMVAILAPSAQKMELPAPGERLSIVLVVGVNGVGKTTTIAKIASRLSKGGYQVMLAAGDTFRAAAVEQLQSWGSRLDVPVIAQGTGADPASVIFDACATAKKRGADVLLADTAGRLHTQNNLMAELAKIRRVAARHDPTAPHETLLVLDATLGQNALSQAEQFAAAADVTGLVLTKLDGTAKGGVIFALAERLGLPIRFIGIGEGAEDLQEFSATAFVDALLGEPPD